MAFADLEDDMSCAEAYLKHCVAHIMEHCAEDLAFFDSMVEKGLLKRLQVGARGGGGFFDSMVEQGLLERLQVCVSVSSGGGGRGWQGYTTWLSSSSALLGRWLAVLRQRGV